MPARLRVKEFLGGLRRRGSSANRGMLGSIHGIQPRPPSVRSAVDVPLNSDDDSSPASVQAPPPEIVVQHPNGAVTRCHSSQSTVNSSTDLSQMASLSRAPTLLAHTRQSVWDEALASEKLSEKDRKLLKGYCTSSPADSDAILQAVTTTLRDVEKKRWVNYSYTWNGRTYKIFKLFDDVIMWVDRFKGIGDIIVQYDPVHAALPWAAARMLLQVVVEDKANMTAIALVVERTTNLIATCSMYIELYLCENFEFTEMLKNAIVQLYTEILCVLALALGYFKRSFRTVRSLLDLKKFGDSLADIDSSMSRVKEVVQLAQSTVQNIARIAQQETFIRLQEKLTDLGKPLAEIGLTTDQLHRDMTEKNQEAFYNWLSPCEYESHHLDQGEGIVENTGAWLFDMSTQFKNWEGSQSSSVLWVRGDPGVGKSRLTYAGIEVAQRKGSGKEFVIYFYCSRGEDTRRRPEIILGTLIKQILLKPGVITPQALFTRYQARNEKGALRLRELQHWLCLLLRSCKSITIFIDAMDEIFPAKRLQFLEVLRAFVKDEENKIKLWISSREEADIRSTFTGVEEVVIERQHQAEIRTYVEREITKHKTLLQGEVDDVFKSQIIDKISEKSEGMFLWAHLQVEDLKRLNRRKHVEERLNTLPKDLTATYDESYQRILAADHSDDCEAAKMALRWVMCAVRPLSPEEWAHAAWLSSTFTQAESSAAGIDDAPDIKPTVLQKLCHSFVSIDNKLNVVRFAHLSVREYLEKKTNFMELSPDYMASQTCLAYLSHSKSITGPFSKYVIDHWSVHCSRVTKSPVQQPHNNISETLLSSIRQFLRSDAVYRRWLSQVNEAEFCQDIDPLFVAARYGLAHVCKDMLQCKDQSATPRNRDRKTPLHAAAQFGHSDVVQLYLEMEHVNVNDVDKDGRTPLAWGVFCGHQAVAKVLLMSPRVEVNIPDDLGKFTPLTRASWRGSEQMVKMLAEANNVEIDKRDGFGMTALMWASRRGDTAVMAALMERGADVNARDNYNRTALHWALISKELEAFLLLAKAPGVDVNCQDIVEMTPLFYACKYRSGRELDKTLKRLLGLRGIDVNAPCYGTTPLMILAETGQHEAVRRLARAPGIQVNQEAHKGRTALTIATLNEKQECVRALVEAARDLNLRHRDASGKTALVYAVEKGSKIMCKQLLVAEGIKLMEPSVLEELVGSMNLTHEHILAKARKEPLSTPLVPVSRQKLHQTTTDAEVVFEIARWASKGATEARQRLTKIDINARNICGETALHLAARYSKKKVGLDIAITLLGTPGIITDPVDSCGKTPLIEAARLGNASLVSKLLETEGVDPNAKDMRGRTALFFSTRDNNDLRKVVQTLVTDPRVDVNATDKHGVTPISQAVHNQASGIVELLLDTGKADVNRVNHMGFTPLTYAAMKGLLRILQLLLNVPGIDIECQDDRWYTPLALAAKYGHKEVVDELVRKGASLVARTNRGLTPLELAEENEHAKIVELLNNAG